MESMKSKHILSLDLLIGKVFDKPRLSTYLMLNQSLIAVDSTNLMKSNPSILRMRQSLEKRELTSILLDILIKKMLKNRKQSLSKHSMKVFK